jgi:hypothetical protein
MAGLVSAMLLAGAVAIAIAVQTPTPATAPTQMRASGGQTAPMASLRQGQLTVWFVGASTHPPQSNLQAVAALHDATPLTYQEKTAGTFGQSASNYGQDSGSYGVSSDSTTISAPHSAAGQDAPTATPNGIGYKEQDPGSFGQSSSNTGTSSGSYGTDVSGSGQSGGSFGQSAGTYGTSASNHGQDVASFGNSTSTIASAGTANAAVDVPQPPSDPVAERFKEKVQHAFPGLQLKFTEVDPDELKDRLIATQGTPSYPDVLVGALPDAWWNGMQSDFGLVMLRPASFYPNGVTQNPPRTEEFSILARALHMREAREFAMWMSEPNSECPGCVEAGLSAREQAAAAVAVSAVERLLSGDGLGDEADPEMAVSVSLGARRMLATIGNQSAGDAPPHVQVEHASTNGNLAAIALRVVVSSPNVFGVTHPLVVLRMGSAKDSRWLVLQVSLNQPQIEQENVRQTLMLTSPTSGVEQRSGVKGVAPAVPQEGATVGPVPDLVWDNNGGAGLQVVEWQINRDHGWSDARLYLVEDRSPRLQTHARAEFASDSGQYRWRVWSVGGRGEMKISPWRSFTVSQ